MNDEHAADRLQLLETLYAAYRQDQASGILDARLQWEAIDDEMIRITADWASSAQEELAAPDPVSLFGTSGYDWAFFVEAQTTIGFHQVMRTLAHHQGNPPATDMLQRYALDILRGRVHLTGAIRLVSADGLLMGALPNVFQMFLPGLDPAQTPILPHAVRVAAAAALPRAELYQLRGVDPGDDAARLDPGESPELVEMRADFRRLMQQADTRDSNEDPQGQESLLIRALDLAAQSPEPDDDLEALERILRLAERVRISSDAVRRCTAAVEMLVARGHHTAAVVRCLTALAPHVTQNDLMMELGDTLISTGSRLLEGELDGDATLALKTTVARAWLGLGRRDQARTLLLEVQNGSLSPVDRLKVAVMEADTLEEQKQRSKAADHLLQALNEANEVSPAVRIPALQKLISIWPEHRETEGLVPYIDELLATARKLKEPRRTMALVGASVRLWQAGRRVQALRAWSTIDEERLRRECPPMLAEKVLSVVQKAKLKLDTSTAETVAH